VSEVLGIQGVFDGSSELSDVDEAEDQPDQTEVHLLELIVTRRESPWKGNKAFLLHVIELIK
jgi:hypothetical protein